MTTVNQMKNNFDEKGLMIIENLIDENLKKIVLQYSNHVEAVISGEYSKTVRDKIAQKYIDEGGWSKVTHRTSSENGERGGLTAFSFYF
jgi:ectoine hydroxylase-related dioxygenase (phytanoyl-CoA dioxygenase family)